MELEIRNLRTAPCGAARSCDDCPNRYCPRRSSANGEFETVSDFDYVPTTADGIAIDIGTTTIAAVRYDNGHAIGRISDVNVQRRRGADVISRIQAAADGAGDELQSMIRRQLGGIIRSLGGEGHKTVVAANTAMVSLFMGWDCSLMGKYPFKVHSTDTVYDGDIIIPGGISAFVGGDITSGLYMCGFNDSNEVNMLIDLGTNGELAIGNKHRILCTSAAAGPAFEGGRISCGTGAVPGAVCSVSLEENTIDTINGEKPSGICGTGLIELMYELYNAGYMDSTGLLIDKCADGFAVADGVVFTQKDIRELQTAKSAIRSGIEILIKEYGADEINNIYIAGSFGKRIDIKKACGIGLLPARYAGRYKAVGNSALGGAVKILEKGTNGIEKLRAVAEDFPLAENPEFSELFIKYMEIGTEE